MTLEQALKEIQRLRGLIEVLEETIADQELTIAELEDEKAELEGELEEAVEYEILDDEEYDEIEERVFLRDIGFDPDRLPKSVGERMDIRSRLESPIPDLSDKLNECQEQYAYLEQHYDRAFELGYDPITKEFYCRACQRAGRED